MMAANLPPDLPSDRFPTTDWRFLESASGREDPGAAGALNEFLRRYWKPVFYFLRTRGYPFHKAEDLTQEFLLRFWSRDLILKADPERGKFRTFLLAVLRRFLSDQGPRAPLQRRFESDMPALAGLTGDEERRFEPPDDETPETIFWKKWMAGALERCRERLRAFHQAEERPEWYAIFEAYHFGDPVSQDELGTRFGLSREQVAYRLRVARTRFERYVRDEVGGEADADDEVGELLALLRA
jgi:RNA polymerase sigma-70 factor (ECF subfamily)